MCGFLHLVDSSEATLGFWIWTFVLHVGSNYFGIGECNLTRGHCNFFQGVFFCDYFLSKLIITVIVKMCLCTF